MVHFLQRILIISAKSFILSPLIEKLLENTYIDKDIQLNQSFIISISIILTALLYSVRKALYCNRCSSINTKGAGHGAIY